MVKCADCGLLALRTQQTWEYRTATPEFRDTGGLLGPLHNELFPYSMCSARVADLESEAKGLSTRLTGRANQVRQVIQGERECDSFIQWQLGLNLQQHIEMRLRRSQIMDQGEAKVTTKPDPRKVFVVYGRDERIRRGMFAFLRALHLDPIEWAKAIEMTGKGSPYVVEVLGVALANAQAIVVVMTPDDEARLRTAFVNQHDPDYEKQLTPQARPNVLFEAGLALGHAPDRTILVEVGNLRPFSDITGRHTIRIDNSPGKRQELANRLRTAGCEVDTSGIDWHSEGDFESEGIDHKLPLQTGYVPAGELPVEVPWHKFRDRYDLGLILAAGVENAPVLEVAVTLRSTLPMQLARIQLELDDQMIEPLSQVPQDNDLIFGRSRTLPDRIDLVTDVKPLFEIPYWLVDGQKHVQVWIRAGGKDCPSEPFTIDFGQG